jgi:tripartite-type tricarboxylate transporter receptor subunit TctC
MTHPSIPVKDAKSLADLAKANPGKYTYGSSGVGSILHLCGEQFKTMAGGLEITHVPYRGSSALMKDLIGGQISMAFDATPSAGPQVENGAIRALGGGMTARMRTMPNLPTLDEQGFKGFDCYTWNAILAPAGTPQPIVERLNGAVQTAMQDPGVFKRLQEVGVDPTPGRGPKETVAFMQAELAKWGPIVKAAGAQAD